MLQYLVAHGRATARELAEVARVSPGRVLAILDGYLRRPGLIRVRRPGRGGGEAVFRWLPSVVRFANLEGLQPLRQTAHCECGRRAAGMKWNQPVCERCHAIERSLWGHRAYRGAAIVPDAVGLLPRAPEERIQTADRGHVCFNCGAECDASCFCHGCHHHICTRCDVNFALGRNHAAEDHLAPDRRP